MSELIQALLNGLTLGSIYALIALGYTMVYGIAKMLNFAHGDIIMVGAYSVIVTVMQLKLHPILAIVISILVCAVLARGADYSDRCELFSAEYCLAFVQIRTKSHAETDRPSGDPDR